MALPVNTVIEVTYRSTLNSQVCMNVFHYVVTTQSTTVGNLDEVEDFINLFVDNGVGSIRPAYAACLPENLTVVEVLGQPIYPIRYRRVAAGVGEQGLRGQATSSNLQASITKQTQLGGRDQVGAVHVPMTAEDSLNGLVVAGLKANLVTLADRLDSSLTDAVGGGVYAPCIYHRNDEAIPKYAIITKMYPQDTTRVMRRRTVGVGK